MLNDGYVEEIVEAKTPASVYLGVAAGLVLSILGIMVMIKSAFGLTAVFVGIILVVISLSKRNVEYEYCLVNDDVEISSIVAKSKRKSICHFTKGDVALVAAADSVYVDNIRQQENILKTKNYTSGNENEDKTYFVFMLSKNNGYEEIYLELGQKAIDHIKIFFKDKYNE